MTIKSRQKRLTNFILLNSLVFFAANSQATLLTNATGANITFQGELGKTQNAGTPQETAGYVLENPSIGTAPVFSNTGTGGNDPLKNNKVEWGTAANTPSGAASSLEYTAYSYKSDNFNLVDGYSVDSLGNLAQDATNVHTDGYITITEYNAIVNAPANAFNPTLSIDQFVGEFKTDDYVLLGRFDFFNGQIVGNSGINQVFFDLGLTQPNSASPLTLSLNVNNTPNNCTATGNTDPFCAYDGITILNPLNGVISEDIALTSWSIAEDASASSLLWGKIGSLLYAGNNTPDGSSLTSVTDTSGTTTYIDSSGNVTVVNVPAPAPIALMLMGLSLIAFRKKV